MPKEELGRATYHAYRLFGVTYLSATGQTPNWNDKVDFELLPFRIYPPMYGFFFIKADIGLPAIKPFTYQEAIIYPASEKRVRIQDADGTHDVPIADVVPPIDVNAQVLAFDGGGGTYCVYSWIGINPLMIAKCDAAVPGVYTRVFGPATLAECEKYVADNGGIVPRAAPRVDKFIRAWIDRMPIGGPKLIVTGEVITPTGGWSASLSRVNPQGFNPNILILQLTVTPPAADNVTQVETKTPARYEEAPPAHPYTGVTIRHAGGEFTIGVGITH